MKEVHYKVYRTFEEASAAQGLERDLQRFFHEQAEATEKLNGAHIGNHYAEMIKRQES